MQVGPIIQGSGLGPTAYAITASDLKTLDANNLLSKFADYTYVIVGTSRRSDIPAENNNISKWAENNNLRLNTGESKEMVISRRRKYDKQPSQQVEIIGIRRITLNSELKVDEHIE